MGWPFRSWSRPAVALICGASLLVSSWAHFVIFLLLYFSEYRAGMWSELPAGYGYFVAAAQALLTVRSALVDGLERGERLALAILSVGSLLVAGLIPLHAEPVIAGLLVASSLVGLAEWRWRTARERATSSSFETGHT